MLLVFIVQLLRQVEKRHRLPLVIMMVKDMDLKLEVGKQGLMMYLLDRDLQVMMVANMDCYKDSLVRSILNSKVIDYFNMDSDCKHLSLT